MKKNLESFKTHLICYTTIEKHALTWELPKTIAPNILIERLDSLTNEEISWIKTASRSLQIRLLADRDLLQYISFLIKDIKPHQLETLLKQIDSNMLLSYASNDVIETLNNNSIPQKYWGIYLSMYVNEALQEKEQAILWKGLDNYYDKIDNMEFFESHKKLFYTKVVASPLLNKINNISFFLHKLQEDKTFFELLQFISSYTSILIDEENCNQLLSNASGIMICFSEILHALQGHEGAFLHEWLNNHNLFYDIKVLSNKLQKAPLDFYKLSKDRTSYISVIYSDEPLFSAPIKDKVKEELLIYAIVHKKKAFLSLIRKHFELFQSIPNKSILFKKLIYNDLINLNTLNENNLKEVKKLTYFSEEWLEYFTLKTYTFNEIALFSKNQLPTIYAQLYNTLNLTVDKKIAVMREIIKKYCLSTITNIKVLADKLSIKPLSHWMQTDFCHIHGLDATLSIFLLDHYIEISHLIPQIKTVSEVRFIINNVAYCGALSTMKEITDNIMTLNNDWLKLKNEFNISADFIKKHEAKIIDFILKDGPHIMLTYLKNNYSQKEPLRRIIIAELMGRFLELKYYKDDIKQELDYPINHNQIENWIHNSNRKKGNLEVWEEDALLPVMQMGVLPHRTCLSYIDGSHSNCLLACHDSNKKLLYLSYQGRIVLRAAIRLTKGSFGAMKASQKQRLEFVDLEAETNSSNKTSECLALFLECAYTARLPKEEQDNAFGLMIDIMKQKAKNLKAHLIISESYNLKNRKDIIKIPFSLYISKSKAGEQYLDSLGGSCDSKKTGNYYFSNYYIGTI